MFKVWQWDARQKFNRIKTYLQNDARLLEVGCGPGSVCLLLRDRGYDVTPLDVRDLSLTPAIRPILYGGSTMPFVDEAFDVALLLTVLHHTSDPARVLLEAGRVASRIIVIEDVYSNRVQQVLTYFMDSLVNLEFFGHPHSNKTDNQWRALFAALGFKLKAAHAWRYLLLFRQVCYVLQPVEGLAHPSPPPGLSEARDAAPAPEFTHLGAAHAGGAARQGSAAGCVDLRLLELLPLVSLAQPAAGALRRARAANRRRAHAGVRARAGPQLRERKVRQYGLRHPLMLGHCR